MTLPTSSNPNVALAAVADLPKAQVPEGELAAVFKARALELTTDLAPHPTAGYRPVVNVIAGMIAGFTDLVATIGGILAHTSETVAFAVGDRDVLMITGNGHTNVTEVFCRLIRQDGEYTPLFINLMRILATNSSSDDAQVDMIRRSTLTEGLRNAHVGGKILVPALLQGYTGLPLGFTGHAYGGLLDEDIQAAVHAVADTRAA